MWISTRRLTKIFVITGLDRVVPVYESMADATGRPVMNATLPAKRPAGPGAMSACLCVSSRLVMAAGAP
jgi:hypothetical protein